MSTEETRMACIIQYNVCVPVCLAPLPEPTHDPNNSSPLLDRGDPEVSVVLILYWKCIISKNEYSNYSTIINVVVKCYQ